MFPEGDQEVEGTTMLVKPVMMLDDQGPECVSGVEEERIIGVLCQWRMTPYEALFIKVEPSLMEKVLVFGSEGDLPSLKMSL